MNLGRTLKPPRSPKSPSSTETPASSGLMTLATSVVAVAALSLAKDVLLPITLALILSFLLAPVVEVLLRAHVPKIVSVVVAVVLGLSVILATGGLIGVQIAGMKSDIPRYATTVEEKVAGLRRNALEEMENLAQRVRRAPAVAHTGPNSSDTKSTALAIGATDPSDDPFVIARRLLQPTLNPLADTLIVFVISIFMLAQREDLRDRIVRLFGPHDQHRTTIAMDEAGRLLGRYFRAQFAINASFGVVITIGLYFIGMPSPALWGVLAALLRFVPYIGAVMGFALPAAVAFAASPGWSMTIWIAALFAIVEGMTGQVIEPLVYGRSTGLSPTAVVVAAVFWTWIWGPVGLILSTPLTLCLVVVGRYVQRFAFLEVLLGDRPALTAPESFYQQIVAAEPDEAEGHAEALLKSMSVEVYYNEVVIKGLQLAADDAARGSVVGSELEQIMQNIRLLIPDLASYCSTTAQSVMPDSCRRPVVCLAGPGPLDEAVAIMLAQLLHRCGITTTVAANSEASRSSVSILKCESTDIICICYLDLARSINSLRYLVRRLRKSFPDSSILVLFGGLWNDDDRVKLVIGADEYTHSLNETLTACVSLQRDAHQPVDSAQDRRHYPMVVPDRRPEIG